MNSYLWLNIPLIIFAASDKKFLWILTHSTARQWNFCSQSWQEYARCPELFLRLITVVVIRGSSFPQKLSCHFLDILICSWKNLPSKWTFTHCGLTMHGLPITDSRQPPPPPLPVFTSVSSCFYMCKSFSVRPGNPSICALVSFGLVSPGVSLSCFLNQTTHTHTYTLFCFVVIFLRL
jgi:hypothetical protein